MSRQHVVEELYQGEVFGEALFNRMLRDVDDDRQRHVVASLLQLETETKALLRPAVAARGLRLDEDDAQRTNGETIAAALGELTWLDKMEQLRAGIADHYLPRYQRIATEAGRRPRSDRHHGAPRGRAAGGRHRRGRRPGRDVARPARGAPAPPAAPTPLIAGSRQKLCRERCSRCSYAAA